MADEKTGGAEVVPPETPVKKPAPTDEMADTIDRFLTGIQGAGIRAMNGIITKMQEKADEIITTLDGGAPPKKQEKPAVTTPPDGPPPQKQG